MTIQELNNKLTQLLKKEIKDSRHVDTGNLLNKAEFNCQENPLVLKLKTPEYILYLDKGKFWSDFIDSKKVTELIGEYIQESLDDLFKFE